MPARPNETQPTLRQRAEARLTTPRDIADMSTQDVQRLVYELQLHQVELEMQNEALLDAQAALKASRDRYTDLYDFAPIGYLSLDHDGVILESNLTAAALLGIERGHLLGQNLGLFFVPDHQDLFYLYRLRVLQSATSQTCELRMRRQDGSAFTAQLTGVVIPPEADRQCRVALSDITTRKVAEEALHNMHQTLDQRVYERTVALTDANAVLQAELTTQEREAVRLRRQWHALSQLDKLAAMRTLLAHVARELNSSLSIVSLESDLLHEATKGSALDEHAVAISQTVQRCAGIAHRALALLHLPPLARESTHLNAVVEDTLALMSPVLQADDIEVRHHPGDDLPALWADPQQLQQALLYLLTNAYDALGLAPAPRRLTLTTWADLQSSQIRLEVTDTGRGIPREHQARIFEPFFTTKPPGQGIGLGLSLCQEIVRVHGGSIAVQSQPGHGTTVLVTLPLQSQPSL
jgi:PAS domain S-box-containing protein